MKNCFYLLILAACYSCSSTNTMSLSVQQPAPVSLPANIKNVAIVHRSKAADENKALDNMHKALSLESTAMVEAGAKSSVSGLYDEIIKNNRFEQVKMLTELDLRSFGAGVFPSMLSWDTVERICRDNHTDVLFSLEFFDTDSKISYAAVPVTIQTGIVNVPAVEQQVTMLTNVKTGWRIYDPSTHTILDEYMMAKDLRFTGRGINPAVAASALIGRKEAVKQVANDAGQNYAYRILPYWIRVSRYYYSGGNESFKIANRMAQTGNWDGAGKIWEAETKNPDPVLAGRGCYNMAIIREINGDLDGAIGWAQKAWENYQTRYALQYVNILRNRKTENAVLRNQNLAANQE